MRLPMLVLFVLFLIILPLAATQIKRSAYANQVPLASFTYSPNNPAPGETIIFDASASYDPDGWITLYRWDFGDGNVTSMATSTITHCYPLDGNYTVELTVTDNSGATGTAAAVIEVSTEVYFRVCFYGTTIPMADVEVTMYYSTGTSWVKAPVGCDKLELRYDKMTQPNLASTPAEKYRNPGTTASILRQNASNIGFDIHPSWWKVYFKFKYGDIVAYWPNHTTRVYTYNNGVVEAHDYSSSAGAYWDPTAGTYVIRAKNIPKNGVSPCQNHPIIVGIFCPPPTPKYYLTVRTDPLGITTIPGQGFYASGTNVTLTAPQYVSVSSDTRYSFTYWDVDGVSKGAGVNPISVLMNANHTATAHYVLQYRVSFAQTALSSDATGTVVTVDGSPKAYGDLPYTKWVNCGTSVTYSYSSTVSSTVSDKRYRLDSVTGPASPITVTGPVCVTGAYVTQYQVTFAQTNLDSTATGAVVTVNGIPKTYADLPYSFWADSGSSVTYSYSSTVSSTSPDTRFTLVAVHSPPSPFIVSEPVTITGEYCKQYKVTFTQTGLDATATGTVVTVNGSAKMYTDLPFTLWVKSGSSITYSYNDPVLSTVTGKRFKLTGVTGPSSPITVTSPVTVTGNYKAQYYITFGQTGVGSDFTGTVVTVDSVNYGVSGLPVSFWWDAGSSHPFEFYSPLVVNISRQYDWSSTTGLSTLQSGTLTVTSSGSVTGNYVVHGKYQVTFDQTGVGVDFAGTVVVIDGTPYGVSSLPVSFWWDNGSTHSFAFASPLNVGSDKRYVWTSTVGLSTLQSGSLTVSASGSVTGNYETQYYLVLATSPPGVASPSGFGWYDANTYATISTPAYVDIVPGASRYRFNGWTTPDMSEITDPTRTPTTVLMDKGKTVTANYVVQYKITFDQTGVGSDYTGTIVTIDGTPYFYSGLPISFWWDKDSVHSFAFSSPLVVTPDAKQYLWTSTTGLSTLQSGSITVTTYGSVVGNYETQYYLVVNSLYGSPTPLSRWFDAGSSITASVTSPATGPTGTRYLCTGWTGTGSVPSTGSGTSVSFTINQPSSITWNWKTQYYLTVKTNPLGITTIPGEGWYDAFTSVALTAPNVSGYQFKYWDVDGNSQGNGVNPVTVIINGPRTATANYGAYTPLSVSISPLLAYVNPGHIVPFTSTVSGGTSPYSYKWYMNGNPVSGANASTWAFQPMAVGTYYVQLVVTDANNNTAQSEIARVIVSEPSVGGYSISLSKPYSVQAVFSYAALLAVLAMAVSLIRRKRK
ncbi:MAG: PKD domain-containing protein [Candidatus Bathyarchaeota archaeon]|nr:PKD domain-containing protein [Candidatus Bathyarchaeota archaeon]